MSARAIAAAPADGFSFSGAVRLRYEAIDGQLRPGFNHSDDLVNLRTNLLAEYRSGNTRFVAELYDSRVWGDDAGTPVTTGEVNALEPVQVFVAQDLPDLFGKGTKLSLAAGRMTLNVGSRRLIASDDYRNTTSGYTGVKADVTLEQGWKSTLLYMLPQTRLPDDKVGIRSAQVHLDRETTDLALWGGLVSKSNAIGPATAELTYLRFDEKDQATLATRDRSLDTFGGRLIVDPRNGHFDGELEVLRQSGHVSTSLAPTAARQAVGASFLHVDVGYSFAMASKPRLSVEFDRASGDKPGGRYGRFDTLFGMRRAELAPSAIYGAVGRANIATPGLRFEATPSKRLDWFATYRAMWLASDTDSFSTSGVRDASGSSGRFAGHQVEGRVRYWILPERLRFEFDGLVVARGRFLRDAPNATPGRWTSYGSVNLTTSF
jgi:hypothetical protein